MNLKDCFRLRENFWPLRDAHVLSMVTDAVFQSTCLFHSSDYQSEVWQFDLTISIVVPNQASYWSLESHWSWTERRTRMTRWKMTKLVTSVGLKNRSRARINAWSIFTANSWTRSWTFLNCIISARLLFHWLTLNSRNGLSTRREGGKSMHLNTIVSVVRSHQIHSQPFSM